MTSVATPAPVDNDNTADNRTLTEAAAYKRLYPVEYLRRFVQEDVRPDGREKDQWRDVRINVGMFIRRVWHIVQSAHQLAVLASFQARFLPPMVLHW